MAKLLGIVLLIGLGIVQLVFPEILWYLRRGIWYRDAEPSDFALVMGRIGGVVIIITAIVLAFL